MLARGSGRAGAMDSSDVGLIFASVLALIWLALMLWGFITIMVSARRRRTWTPNLYVTGVLGSCALGAGFVLTISYFLPPNAWALGAPMMIAGGLAIGWVGYGARRPALEARGRDPEPPIDPDGRPGPVA